MTDLTIFILIPIWAFGAHLHMHHAVKFRKFWRVIHLFIIPVSVSFSAAYYASQSSLFLLIYGYFLLSLVNEYCMYKPGNSSKSN
jgi:hypothetical protein